MRKISLLVIAPMFILFSIGCSKEVEEIEEPIIVEIKDSVKEVIIVESKKEVTVVASGQFQSAEHTTIGEVKVVKDTLGNLILQFSKFKTDPGPDLFIYFSQDLKAKNFVSTKQRPVNGTYEIDIDDNIDFKTYNHVLIWCKSFSVLFGNAELK